MTAPSIRTRRKLGWRGVRCVALSLVAATFIVQAAHAAPPPADASPPRSPEQRQQIVDLAHLLGESHAFRQLCAGAGDQAWRNRMDGLLTIEAPDTDFRRRLVASFNAGFAAGQAEFPQCDAAAMDASQDAAARAAAIARRLAGRGP